jgi:hypothetical protein
MSFVGTALALGGSSALLGAGGSIWGGLLQREAAKEASAVQSDAYQNSRTTLRDSQGLALNYLDPFRQFGLSAGSSLQDALYSPEQRMGQIEDQRSQLQGEVDRLKAALPVWERFPILTGKNASERRASMFTEQYNAGQTALAQAKAKLDTFNQQAGRLEARAQSGGPQIQESPWYKFQEELLGRSMDRHFAARGLTGSGFEAEEKRRGLIELGAGETERQFNRITGLYNTGANLAQTGAGVVTGTAEQIANTQIGQGRAEAQGILGAADANVGMINGTISAFNSGAGTYLGAKQWNDYAEILRNRNKPTSYEASSLPGYGVGGNWPA